MAKKLVLRFLLFSACVLLAFGQALVTVAAVSTGLCLVCFAFMDQPTWISAPALIGGAIVFAVGIWISETDLPLPGWWARIEDSVNS